MSEDIKPLAGMVVSVATRSGGTRDYRVTTVRSGYVYLRSVAGDRAGKVRSERFAAVVQAVVSMPEPKQSTTAPRMTTTQAARLYARAYAAGLAAGDAVVPTPMVVAQHASPFDDTSAVVKAWHVPSGACGFAWITVRPGNSSFARWLKLTGRGRAAYGGGVSVRVSEYGQSMERKEAHARAFAAVLREAGVKAYAESRMD